MADTTPQSLEQLEHRVRNSGSWCYWIAALTAVNAIAAAFDSQIGFALGSVWAIAVMQMAASASKIAQALALGFNVLVIAFFVLMGVYARKAHRWAFGVAFLAYLGDSLILIAAPDVLSIGLHLWALFSLGSGFLAVKALREARAAAAAEPPALTPVPASEAPPPVG